MRAMVLDSTGPVGPGRLRAAVVPDPEPGSGEIRVRVAACGVCRTDLHVVEGDLPAHGLPRIPGHQVVGRVESRGAGADRFREGERVGIAWLRRTCGRCPDCRSGRENLCPYSKYTGWDADGGYAELAVVHEAFAYPIPESFSDAEATPLLCAGIIGFRALTRARVPEGGTLALFGFGSSAHVVIQIARHRGYDVVVATRGEKHRALAREMGASWVGDTFDPLPSAADSAIVFAPAGEVVPAALRAVRKAGTVALAGVTMTDLPAMAYGPHLFHEKVLTSVESNTRDDGEGLLREAAAIPLRPRVTTFPLDRAGEVLLRLKEDGVEGTAVLVP